MIFRRISSLARILYLPRHMGRISGLSLLKTFKCQQCIIDINNKHWTYIAVDHGQFGEAGVVAERVEDVAGLRLVQTWYVVQTNILYGAHC